MCNICVFAGTTEGRELVEFLAGQPVLATVCVATEYGKRRRSICACCGNPPNRRRMWSAWRMRRLPPHFW